MRQNYFADSFPNRGDFLLIYPPFADPAPSLGLHIIESISVSEGLSTNILYANLSLASALGSKKYCTVTSEGSSELVGEFLFSSFVFQQCPPHSYYFFSKEFANNYYKFRSIDLLALEKQIQVWLDEFRFFIRKTDYAIYGFSTIFSQNLASTSMSKIIREEKPSAKIIIGGANCAGRMSSGIVHLCNEVDFIFSGESELTFLSFCKNYKIGNFPINKILYGSANDYWKTISCPNYHTFFDQLQFWFPKDKLIKAQNITIPYETSRGCWWGQKNHCKFCGLNNTGMVFRQKDALLAYKDLKEIAKIYPTKYISMTDNIMPLSYFKDLIPQLAQAKLDIKIFYEQKSNLKRSQLRALYNAGILAIQPGIEALSTNLLKAMNKGVSAAQNIAILRDCRSLGIEAYWNILYGFPDENVEDFHKTIELIPLLVHLDPPARCSKVSFDRFSPYFNDPKKFGIKNIRPMPAYFRVYPEDLVPINDIAYHFIGDVQSIEITSPDTLKRLMVATKKWITRARKKVRPVFCVAESTQGLIVIDTRFPGKPRIDSIDEQMAHLITSNNQYTEAKIMLSIAYKKKWAVEVDGFSVGLASTISDKVFLD